MSKHQTGDDADITAHNLNYFGDPVCEYTLIEAQEDGYLAACEIVKLKPSIDWPTFTRDEVLSRHPIDARTGKYIEAEDVKAQYVAKNFDDDIVLPERIAAMCEDLFKRLCEHGGPEQKVIIFCARDLHADRVAMQMQRLYATWCRQQGTAPKDHYAFKCTAEGGADLIEQMRGSGERCFVACTVDLLATGVDIERLNAAVFFRRLQSSITFYQMVGRGTRIDEPTQKYKFWVYDYSGVTDLFGTDFITAAPPPRKKKPGGEGPEGPEEPPETPPALPERTTGHTPSRSRPDWWVVTSHGCRSVDKQKANAVALKDRIAVQKKLGAKDEIIHPLRAALVQAEKAAREAQAKADGVDSAVYDLKAVNPRARATRDTRKPAEIIEAIAAHGRALDNALATLRALIAGSVLE